MDTLGFLRAILPDAGIYYVALFKDGHGAPAHKAYTSLETMAEAIEKFDRTGRLAVYHACSSYREPHVVESNGKKMYRKPPNWRCAKSLWIDVDCGADKAAEGKGYPTKKAAWEAIAAFCDASSFPRPMIVDSGNGLHAYWPFTKAVKPATWQAMARLLELVLDHYKVLVDHSRTHDFASVLRPPGTINRKHEPKPVVVRRECDPRPPEELYGYLVNIVKVYSLAAQHVPSGQAETSNINDDLCHATYQHVDASAVLVADNCMQVARVRDTKGDASYNHWRGVIGLIKHCTEGISLAREWSEQRAATGHDSTDVLTRYETWSTGPPTCEFFVRANPGGCDGCQYKGKITSPITLGRVVPEPQEQILEGVVNGEKVKVEVPKFPKGYEWKDGTMIRFVRSKDNTLNAHAFCRTLFYPTHRIRKEDGLFSIGLRVHLPDNRTRQIEIETGMLASNQKLMEALGNRAEITQMNPADSSTHMTAYLRDSLELLKAQAEELSTMVSFGWKDNQSFLVGDRLYLPDNTMRRVLVGGYAADYLSSFPPPRGTVEDYAKAVNYIYAREGMEPLQYAFCSGFGSILTPFGESLYNGLLVALVGGESARGKTTVAQMAMNAFGNAARMTLGTEHGATVNATYAKMGTYGSIPVLFDEYTNVEPKDFSEFAYRISQGTEKERLTLAKTGTRKADQVTWKMSPYVTANKDLHGLLSAHSPNSQAEAVRMIQIKIDEYDTHLFDDREVSNALRQTEENWGTVGEVFIRHIVNNHSDVRLIFDETNAELSPQIPGPKYRYYRNHAAATLTAAKLLNILGITTFDIDRLAEYTVHLLRKLCADVTETNMITAEDALSMMINDLTPRIIISIEYRDARDPLGPEMTNRQFHTIAGRYVQGNSKTKKESMHAKLLLVRHEVKTWCMKHRVEMNGLLDYAKKQDILVNDNQKLTITRGTDVPNFNARCVVLDMLKLNDVVGTQLKLVVPPASSGTTETETASM